MAGLGGCATAPAPDVVHGPLTRGGALPPVAVVVSALPLESAFEAPYADRAQAFGTGATKAGAEYLLWSFPLLVGAGPAIVFLGPVALAALAAPAAGIALMGGAAAAATVPPEETTAALGRMAAVLAAELQLSPVAQDVASATSRFAGRRADVIDAATAGSPGALPQYSALRDRGYGSVVEVRLTRTGYASAGGIGAGVGLFLVAEARLVDAATGKPARLRGLLYQSAPHQPEAWVRDDARLAKLELAKAQRTIAERIVDDLLLETDATFGPGSASPRTCGLEPIRPAVEWSWTGNLRTLDSQPSRVSVDSVNPVLAWQPRPSTGDARVPPTWTRVTDVGYDLRVWNEIDGAPGAIVYERLGLTVAQHRVELPLVPKSTYYWSVRMRYTVDGHPRATRWSAANTPRLVLPASLTKLVYYSRIEGNEVVPRACGEADLDSCGCLDFIPARSHYSFGTP
jgi:hypothetical protein